MCLKTATKTSMKNYLEPLKQAIEEADCIVIGAGAGLSTSAGFEYSGPRFNQYFSDFINKYLKEQHGHEKTSFDITDIVNQEGEGFYYVNLPALDYNNY